MMRRHLSYKQLPLNLYQIQTKFRDEPARARACCAAASSS
jgi:prolyl-tRNA synthetase